MDGRARKVFGAELNGSDAPLDLPLKGAACWSLLTLPRRFGAPARFGEVAPLPPFAAAAALLPAALALEAGKRWLEEGARREEPDESDEFADGGDGAGGDGTASKAVGGRTVGLCGRRCKGKGGVWRVWWRWRPVSGACPSCRRSCCSASLAAGGTDLERFVEKSLTRWA